MHGMLQARILEWVAIFHSRGSSRLRDRTCISCAFCTGRQKDMFHDPHRNAERASLVAQTVKNLPAVRETQVRSLGREDPLEKEMAPHSSILAWRIPWIEKPGGLQSLVLQSQLSN